MKTPLIKPLLLSLAFVGVALNASAQSTAMTDGSATTPVYGSSYGLLGQDYAGVTFGYTDLDRGPAHVVHSYGFHANRPTQVPNLDAAFKYEYSRLSAFGNRVTEHDVAIGATKFLTLAQFKPFLEGNVGWAFLKNSFGGRADSFFYLAGIGAEFQALPRLAVAPYVNYQEAPHLHARNWNYGAKATYRVTQQWSGTVVLELNDDSDLTFKIGVNRHF